MAYLNEFPKWDSNGRNLDWLLEQYSTFEKRLQEIRDEFTETVTRLEGNIESLENTYQRELDLFEGRINTLVGEITRKVDSINEHTETYVNNYLTENIETILQDNPVLETKFEKIGYIDTNESVTYNLETDVIYEVMTIDYALNMHKGLAVNNACYLSQVPYLGALVVADVTLIGSGEIGDPYTLDVNEGRVLSDVGTIELYTTNNVLRVYNGGTNRIRVYIKPIAAL